MSAPVLPTGGAVVNGSASIANAPSSVIINQSSNKAIINWSGFSVDQGASVQFNNGSGATLNRVTGTDTSAINGALNSTGSVYLINPNGVIIGKTGVVKTGGTFAASTQDITDSNFRAGGPLNFKGTSKAAVINLGKVGSLGGNVALIASTVRNEGAISAPNGTAGLAAGYSVTMKDTDNDGDGLFSVKVGGADTSSANSGTINAAAAELRAQQGNVYALAGNRAGVVNATGVNAQGGHIWLVADGGTTTVAGTLNAQGVHGTPGQIETSGEKIAVGDAHVDAHGGTWTLDIPSI